jgi:hypothetical protein
MMRRRAALRIVVLTTSIGSSVALSQATDNDQGAVRSTFESWRKVANTGDADAFLSYVTDDAIFADIGARSRSGRRQEGPRAVLQGLLRDHYVHVD